MSEPAAARVVAAATDGRAALERASRILTSLGHAELAEQTTVVVGFLERAILVPFATRHRQLTGEWPASTEVDAAALEQLLTEVLAATPGLAREEVAAAVGRRYGSAVDNPRSGR